MVPPWAVQHAPLADKGRFAPANRNLGDFIKTGNKDRMRRGVGQYIKKGYGGSRTATTRMSGTAAKAETFYSALLNLSQHPLAQIGGSLEPALMAGKSINEVIDAVVEAVAPIDGTQDTEVSRESTKHALSELLDAFPDVDLLNLEAHQREFALERFVSYDVYQRLYLDLGKSILSKAPSPVIALSRLKEVKDYIKETVAAAFRNIKASGIQLQANMIAHIVSNAICETFEIFEGYAE